MKGSVKKFFDEWFASYEIHHPWALGRAEGEFVLGAHLPTRDGRRMGNAHIVAIEELEFRGEKCTVYHVLTDAGSTASLVKIELEELFHPPEYCSDVAEVLRKFDRDGVYGK